MSSDTPPALAPSAEPDRPRSTTRVVACLLAIASLVALDLWTKAWAEETLSHERLGHAPPVCAPAEDGLTYMQRARGRAVVLIPGYLELRYAENCGAAFGLMRQAPLVLRRGIFGVAAIAASLALLWMFRKGRGGRAFAASVPLIVSGALGNFVDRVRYGYVVDFIRFHIQNQWEWPTFNIADSTITIGVVLLLLDGYFEGRRLKESEAGLAEAQTRATP